MNSILHIPTTTTVVPATKKSNGERIPNKYRLEVTYKAERHSLIYNAVYIPAPLAEALASWDIECFHMVALRLGRPEARVLANHPQYVMMGVKSRDGRVVSEVPATWRKLWWRNATFGALLLSASVLVGATHQGIAVAAACALISAFGVARLIRAWGLDLVPFRVISIWSR